MTEPVRVAVGSDHAGFALKAELCGWLKDKGFVVTDHGTYAADHSVDYPDIAHTVAALVASGDSALGVLVCGSGVGMSIAANRHLGVRAVVCSESYSARLAREHNDANVLCLGARVVGPGVARDCVEAFFAARFEGGRHAGRVRKIEP